MKQRTVFASALLHTPRVLVVDEPMVGLDPHSIRVVKDLLQWEVAQGMCVLMSTHTLAAAEEISDRVGIMSHGQLVFDGTISELRQQCRSGESVARSDVSCRLPVTTATQNGHAKRRDQSAAATTQERAAMNAMTRSRSRFVC